MNGDWLPVVFAADCDEDGRCPICGDIDYAECVHPGPTQDGIEYREHDGTLQGRRVADLGVEL